MQIGGLGDSHGTNDHHVTNCIHDHHEIRKNTGGMPMKPSASMEASAVKSELQQEGLFSLSAWMKSILGNGKGFLLNFWDGGQTPAGSTDGNQTMLHSVGSSQAAGAEAAAAQTENPGMASATVAVQSAMQPQAAYHNSDFSSVKDTEPRKRTLWQKMRMGFQNVSGQLSRRRSQKYFGFRAKNSFQAKQEKPEENLREHNRHCKDTVEINCTRTEDSYLMDSYDRRGEYSRLTTKK